MSVDLDPPGVPPTLNDQQYAVWRTAPYAAQLAAGAVSERLGGTPPPDALLPLASRSTMEAAACFEPVPGLTFHDWAFFFVTARLFEALARAHREDKALLSRIRATGYQFLQQQPQRFDPWKDTKETARGSLAGFSDALLFAAVSRMATPAIAARGEEDVVLLEDARRAGEAVRKVVGELRPEQRVLVERCAAHGEVVKAFAKETGQGYRKVLDDLHETLGLCGARLAGLGIRQMPAWIPEVSGQVFEDPPANDLGEGKAAVTPAAGDREPDASR